MRLGDLLRSRGQETEQPEKKEPGRADPALQASQAGGRTSSVAGGEEDVVRLPIEVIRPNRWQPRLRGGEEEIEELAQSIASQGLLSPIIVRPAGDGAYELVAGERRLRACERLGWREIPCIVRGFSDREAAEAALVENLQRSDLHFLEEARAYQRLLEEFGLTQEELAGRLGKSQPAIANKLRLLRLSPRVQEVISREMISERQARALLAVEDEGEQLALVREIKRRGLSAERAERLAREWSQRGRAKAPGQRRIQVMRDLRPFRNSLMQLVQALNRAGLVAQVDEEEAEDGYRITITIRGAGQGAREKGAVGGAGGQEPAGERERLATGNGQDGESGEVRKGAAGAS